VKIAINSYIKLDVLKKKIDDIKDIESLMKNEQELKNKLYGAISKDADIEEQTRAEIVDNSAQNVLSPPIVLH